VVGPLLPRHYSRQDIKGPPPQQHSRLVRLADSRCRKRPCCGRTYRCRSRRCRSRWLGRYRSCRFSCRLLRRRFFSCWLLGSGFLCCRLLRRYLLFGCRLFSSDFLGCWFLRRYLLGCWLLGSDFLCCRLLCSGFLGCWFCFLLCYHVVSPSIMKVKKYNTCNYYTYTPSPCPTSNTGQSRCLKPGSRYPTLIPGQRATGLIFGDTGFEKVLLLLEIYHLRHPRERIGRTLI
jgi:hypothetical protein